MKILNVRSSSNAVARVKDEERKERVWRGDENASTAPEGNVRKKDVIYPICSNNLIVKLEKEKNIQEKKDFKENLIRENEEAVKRMTAL